MQLLEHPSAKALDFVVTTDPAPAPSRRQRRAAAAKVEPIVDPLKRAEDMQKATLAGKHTGNIRPAALEPAAPKKKAEPSAVVAQIRSACEALNVEIKPFANNPDSFVVRLPDVSAFLKTLPETGATEEARMFIALHKAVAGITRGDSKATWVFHKAGSFALYGKM